MVKQDQELEYLIGKARRHANNGSVLYTDLEIMTAKKYAKEKGLALPEGEVKEIMNLAYRNGIKRELKEAKNRIKKDSDALKRSLSTMERYAKELGKDEINKLESEVMPIYVWMLMSKDI